MQLSWDTIQSNAIAFSKRWKDASDEKSDGQNFVRDFLAVFGVEDAAAVGRFEERALRESGRGFMDFLWPKKIAVEMKSKGKDLKDAYRQLKDYVLHLSTEVMPDLMMVSDFENIVLYRRTTGRKKQFKTKELRKHVRHFYEIAGYETTREIEYQFEVNVQAAEKMARLHDALKSHGFDGHDLEVYLVRLLFCLFADNTEIFPQQEFLYYVENSKEDGSDLSARLAELFKVLNMSEETRSKRTLLSPVVTQFRYIDGGLFQDLLPSAEFDTKMRQVLLDCCRFDWSKISPAIFGAMFQGVMDKDKRREIGAHYTSEENILRVINPLFMDKLWEELELAKTDKKRLDLFHEKISQLKFLDPACGCGNFLIIAYRELRLLELEILKMRYSGRSQKTLDISTLLKVNVEQFYGIEIEDFPCEIAKAGLWLVDHQMNQRVSEHFGKHYVRLPLTQGATIVRGNALRIDWENVVPKKELSYILGNPPYNGARTMSTAQKEDITEVVEKKSPRPLRYKNLADNLDYVAAWYFKVARYIQGLRIPVAFVSTNSICQGEQVAPLWDTLLNDYGMEIHFAYRTFKWTNAAKGKAAVHCIIIGFGDSGACGGRKIIFEGDGFTEVPNISPYLVDAPNIIIKPQKKPLCNVPEMKFGSQPRDGGFFVLTPKERKEILRQEPALGTVIKPYIGAEEFLHNQKRYCIWLLDAPLGVIKNSRILRERIAAVREFRLSSRAKTTNQYAKVPAIFAQIAQPNGNYLLVPGVSSENRRYIPVGFLHKNTIASNAALIIPYATLYHFGILTSSVHNAWMRAVCGRLEMRYRYSKELVYNTFPWPEVNEKQKNDVETAAKAILAERARHSNTCLADLYDPVLITTTGLQKAHQTLDRAVMKLYGFGKDLSEHAIVAKLMEMYQKLTMPPTLIPEPEKKPGSRKRRKGEKE
ncbi:MAG: hypothetical protein FWC43_02280 [Planctomycetaceae bacterium]|nr:hypothetical protein [Planctomycetaceae bacterium]